MNRPTRIALASFATFVDGYDIQALGLAVPGMAESMGVAPSAFAGAMTLSLAGMAAGAIGLAPLADRFGRIRLIVASLLLIAVSGASLALAATPSQVAGLRFITGLGMGALMPLAITLAAEACDPGRRSLIVTIVASCAAIGSFASGMLAPLVEAWAGWQGIFLLGAGLPLLLTAAFLPGWSEPRPGQNPQSASRPVRLPVVGLFQEQLRKRTVLVWVIFFGSLFATYCLISWLPTLLDKAGWPRADAQRAAGVMAAGSLAGGLTLAWLADKGHAAIGLTAGLLVAAIALLAIGANPATKLEWFALLFLVGAGAIGSQMALGAIAAGLYPVELRAAGLGWSSGMGRAGSLLGPSAVVALIAGGFPAATIVAALSVPMIVCAGCAWALAPSIKQASSIDV